MEVQFKQVNFAWCLAGAHVHYRFQIEDLSKNTSFISIGACFLERLRLVLVQLCIEEEQLLEISHIGVGYALSVAPDLFLGVEIVS